MCVCVCACARVCLPTNIQTHDIVFVVVYTHTYIHTYRQTDRPTDHLPCADPALGACLLALSEGLLDVNSSASAMPGLLLGSGSIAAGFVDCRMGLEDG